MFDDVFFFKVWCVCIRVWRGLAVKRGDMQKSRWMFCGFSTPVKEGYASYKIILTGMKRAHINKATLTKPSYALQNTDVRQIGRVTKL